MSIRIMTMVLNVKLGSTARKVVALKLADCADDNGENVFPSVARLAAECEVSERTVQYVLREFEDPDEVGILEVVAKGGAGRKSTTEYRFNLSKLGSFPRSYGVELTSPAKGAKSAPLKKALRVQPASSKGANSVVLGCTPCTRTIKEPSRPLVPKPQSRSSVSKGTKVVDELREQVKAIEAAAPAVLPAIVKPVTEHNVRILSPQGRAWLKYWDDAGREDRVSDAIAAGVIRVPSLWPPKEAAE